MTLDSDNANPTTTRVAVTVSALNRMVAGALIRSFPLVRVAGEVGSFSRAASGHWYFVLKDTAAQVRCVMFRSRNALLANAPRDGESVEVLALVTLYEPRGEFQLNVESLQRAGVGRLYEEFVRVRDRLAAAGVFDPALKRAVPRFARRVGVVTSLQAAALRDVLAALQRRAPYLQVFIYPTPVQGTGCGPRIAAALAQAAARREVDVVLLVRGGGSLEDLWSFNDEVVARAIRASDIPIVCGVGHESDVTIADLAADVRAPTPTAAAELVAPSRPELLERIAACFARLTRQLQWRLDRQRQRLDYAQRATAWPGSWLGAARGGVNALSTRLDAALRQAAMRPAARLAALRQRIGAHRHRVDRSQVELTMRDRRLREATLRRLSDQRTRLDALARALAHLDPSRVLERGYALVFDAHGHAVVDATRVMHGARLDVRLARGALDVRVEGIQDRGRSEDFGAHD